MGKPKRIQCERTKGWRMPEGAVYVGRPSIFGNPFWHTQRFVGLEASLNCFRDAANGFWDGPEKLKELGDGPFRIATDDWEEWHKRLGEHPIYIIRKELRGKDLACWCSLCFRHREGKPLNEECSECAPCHADILLAISNNCV